MKTTLLVLASACYLALLLAATGCGSSETSPPVVDVSTLEQDIQAEMHGDMPPSRK